MQMVGVAVEDGRQLARLWAHESMRVFHDRLVSDEDRAWFCALLKDAVGKHMGLKFENVFEPPESSGLKKVRGRCLGCGRCSCLRALYPLK
jgi:dynein heavy chain, axonemal